MPTYEITAPDGRVLEVTGDKPPTPDQVKGMFAQLPPMEQAPPGQQEQQGPQMQQGDSSWLTDDVKANMLSSMPGSADNMVEAIAKSFRQGMMDVGSGVMQRAADLAQALGYDTEDFRGKLRRTMQIERGQHRGVEQEYPVSSFAGRVGGNIAALPVGPASVPKAIAAGAATGALQYVDDSSGQSDIGEIGANMVSDAIWGGVGAKLGQLMSPVARKGKEFFLKKYYQATGKQPPSDLFDGDVLSEKGQKIAREMGFDQESFAKMYRADPDAPYLDPEQIGRLQRAKEQGVDLSQAQVRKDFELQEAENTLRAGTGKYANEAREFAEKQQGQLQQAVDQFKGKFGPSDQSKYSAGETIQEGLRGVESAAKAETKGLYDKAKAAVKNVDATPNNLDEYGFKNPEIGLDSQYFNSSPIAKDTDKAQLLKATELDHTDFTRELFTGFDDLWIKSPMTKEFREHGLSTAEVQALENYTNDGYKALNRKLKDITLGRKKVDQKDIQGLKAYTEILDAGLDKLPKYVERTAEGKIKPTYRRVAMSPEELSRYKEGTTVDFGQYASTSYGGFDPAFKGNVKMVVYGKGANLDAMGASEREVLFKPSQRMKVARVGKDSEGNTVMMLVERGETVSKSALDKAFEQANAPRIDGKDLILDKADELMSERVVEPTVANKIEQALAKYGLIPGKVEKRGRFNHVVTDDGKSIQIRGDVEDLNLVNTEDFRKAMNAIYPADKSGTAKGIIDALDKQIDASIKNIPEGADYKDIIEKARASHAQNKKVFAAKDVVQKLVDYKKGTETNMVEPDRVIDTIFSGGQTLTDLRKVRNALMYKPSEKSEQAWRAIQQQGAAKVLNQAINPTTRAISGQRLESAIKKFGGGDLAEGERRLEVLLGDQFSDFKKLVGTIKDATVPLPNTTNTSGTAYVVLNFMSRLANSGPISLLGATKDKIDQAWSAKKIIAGLRSPQPDKRQKALDAMDQLINHFTQLTAQASAKEVAK